MSFLKNLTLKNIPHKKISHKGRKDKKDSLTAIIYISERTSAFTSKGSLTLEAAIVVPIFFFAILCLAYLLEMMAIQTTMRNGLYNAGKEAARWAYTGEFMTSDELEQYIIENVGIERIEHSIIAGGTGGINCDDTKNNWTTGVMDLIVQYKIEIPILMFRITPIICEEKMRVKGWTGYVSTAKDMQGEDMVYVTETGIVYHRDENCTYLDMAIHSVRTKELEQLRNLSGGKYYACEKCEAEGGEGDIRYITDYGTRYHKSLECKKIHRNIYVIPIEEAYGLGGCSKCVK